MASMDEQAFGITMLGRPLFTSLFVGLILGDVQQGVIVGAALESMFMGAIMVGAAVPPEVYAFGVLGCAFAVITGTGTATAVALALPVSVFLLYSVINFATRIVAAHLGYDLGTKFLQQSEENNLMSRMTHAAGVLGMTVIGAMIAAQVSLSTALTFDVGGSEIVLQDLFDSIFPGCCPCWQRSLALPYTKRVSRPFGLLLASSRSASSERAWECSRRRNSDCYARALDN